MMAGSRNYKQAVEIPNSPKCVLWPPILVHHLQSTRLGWSIRQVEQLAKVLRSFRWTDTRALAIRMDAWNAVLRHSIEPLTIFCHPRALEEQPPIVLYYRTLALANQNTLSSLTRVDIPAIETGKYEWLDRDSCTKIATVLNRRISSTVSVGLEHAIVIAFAVHRRTIQRAWCRGIVGAAKAAMRTLLVNVLQNEIAQIVWADGKSAIYTPDFHPQLVDRIADVRVVRLKQGYHLLFASEPDLSLRDKQNLPVLAIEVKAGSDAAGALERLGAGMKSFENDKNLNPRVKTVYVVRAMTDELARRISHSNPFDYTFGLSELLAGGKAQKTFSNLVLRTVLGR
jgi:hypothetical protein